MTQRAGYDEPSAPAAEAGRVVAGVRLRELVGRGSTGQVWAGTDLSDGCRVAVKLLDAGPEPADVALAQGLRHPHVLAVLRVQQDPPAVVTPLAGGGSLAAQVAARGGLGPGEVVTVLAPLADALAWLHARGVVHGDVSATNVLFVERGRPVLADLGSARLAGTGHAVATPGFAAPEVVAGAEPTPASDVHGLAAVGWLALTGHLPVHAEDRLPLRLLVPDCPEALVEAVLRGLDPDPAARPGPAELAALVRSAARPEPVGLVPSAAVGVRPEEAVTYRVRQAARADDARPRRGRVRLRVRLRGRLRLRSRVVATAVGAATAVAAAVVLVLAVGGGSSGVLPGGGDTPGPPGADDVVAAGDRSAAGTGAVGAASPTPELVAGLVAARQAALRSGDVTRLDRVHHPDGRTLGADRALLAAGPVAVTYRVLAVDPVPADPVGTSGAAAPDEPWRASVRLSTALGLDPAVTEEVVVELGRHEGRWLLRAVDDG
ncbi:protein kinase [Jannaschia sp. R86511]|uniref:serine/threonine-protein kinase n=1 Tax=Jannaschia sp. R86511 TaxID=3093853 RepID=UPI0036D2F8B5